MARNLFVDLDGLSSGDLIAATVVAKRDPVTGDLTGERFLHCLLGAAPAQGLGVLNQYTYEYEDELPESMRNAEGTTLHQFAGHDVYANQAAREAAETPE